MSFDENNIKNSLQIKNPRTFKIWESKRNVFVKKISSKDKFDF